MKKNSNKIYRVGLSISAILVLCTLFRFTDYKYGMAILLSIIAVFLSFFFQRSRILQVNYKKVRIIVGIFALLYIALFYTMGIYVGFYQSTYFGNFQAFLSSFIPIIIITVITSINVKPFLFFILYTFYSL